MEIKWKYSSIWDTVVFETFSWFSHSLIYILLIILVINEIFAIIQKHFQHLNTIFQWIHQKINLIEWQKTIYN